MVKPTWEDSLLDYLATESTDSLWENVPYTFYKVPVKTVSPMPEDCANTAPR